MKSSIVKFVFNAFQENTFLIHDGSDCVIFDPGCSTIEEQEQLVSVIEEKKLNPQAILLTHGHLDHIMGLPFLLRKYKLDYYIHKDDIITMKQAPVAAQMYGITEFEATDQEPKRFLTHGETLRFGKMHFKVLFTPGHAPGHVVFFNEQDQYVVNGDVLFEGSFGRYDLPGGNLSILKKSITEVMFKLPDDTIVLTGHGNETTIGQEKNTNPINRM